MPWRSCRVWHERSPPHIGHTSAPFGIAGPSSWLATIPVATRIAAPQARLTAAPMAGKAIPYTIGPSACPRKKLKACSENEEALADGASFRHLGLNGIVQQEKATA